MGTLTDNTVLRDRIRRQLGNPAQLDELAISDAIQDTVRRLTMHTQTLTITVKSFTTVANQQEYSVESDVFLVEDVSWPLGSALTAGQLFPGMTQGIPASYESGSGLGRYPSMVHDGALQLISEIERKQMEVTSSLGASWDMIGDKIILMPPPTKAGDTVRYLALVDRTLTEINERYREAIVKGAAADCCTVLAAMEANRPVVSASDEGPRPRQFGWRDQEKMLREQEKAVLELIARGARR